MMKSFVVAAAARNRRFHSSNKPKMSVSQTSKHISYYTAIGKHHVFPGKATLLTDIPLIVIDEWAS